MITIPNIEINLDSIKKGLSLLIDARQFGTLFDAGHNAAENNEARIQLKEGFYYDYQLTDPAFILGNIGENIIQQHKRISNSGTISPNIFVGTLAIPVLEKEGLKEVGSVELEVQSVKTKYREDYRDMLEFITEKCTELLLQASSPVSQKYEFPYSDGGW